MCWLSSERSACSLSAAVCASTWADSRLACRFRSSLVSCACCEARCASLLATSALACTSAESTAGLESVASTESGFTRSPGKNLDGFHHARRSGGDPALDDGSEGAGGAHHD